MSSDANSPGWWEFLGRDRRPLYGLTLLYIAIGLGCIATDYTLNDEGLVTVTTADLARHFPRDILFVQKIKPVLTFFYRFFAGLGVHGLLCVHLLVSAPAIPMMAAVGRSLGFAAPNLPALALAASPAFLLAAPAGLSNADGVVGLTAVLYLLVVRRNDLAAGVVLGMLPWVRHELSLFAAVMIIRALFFTRSPRFVIGALLFPLFYGVLGGIYHHDPIWLVHYPPSTLFPMPNTPIWVYFSYSGLLRGLLSLSPLLPLIFCCPLSRVTPIERWLLGYAVAWLGLAMLLPAWQIANFAFVPRYMMVVVPVIALAVGRSIEAWRDGEARLGSAAAATILLCIFLAASNFTDTAAVGAVIAGSLVALITAYSGRNALAATLLTSLLAIGPCLGIPTEIPRRELAPYLTHLADWLRSHPEHTGGPIFTNVPLLAAYLDGAARLPGKDIRYMIGVDQAFDMEHMTSTQSGQRGVIHEMMAAGKFNGARGVLPDQVTPDQIPDGALFVFRHDRRLELLLPPEVWAPHFVDLYNEDFRIATFVSAPKAASPAEQ